MIAGADHDLLAFVAAHEVVLPRQAAGVLQISDTAATERLEHLRAQRLVTRVQLSSRLPGGYRITRDGTELIDGALPPLRALDWVWYRHEVAIVWLWASARVGRLGELKQALSRREMQAADTTQRSQSLLNAPGATFNDQPPDVASQDPRHAYPDLGLVQADAGGGWATLDVILTPLDPQRLKAMLGRVIRDRLIRAQLFLVEQDAGLDQAIKTAAQQLGIADTVHIQQLASIDGTDP